MVSQASKNAILLVRTSPFLCLGKSLPWDGIPAIQINVQMVQFSVLKDLLTGFLHQLLSKKMDHNLFMMKRSPCFTPFSQMASAILFFFDKTQAQSTWWFPAPMASFTGSLTLPAGDFHVSRPTVDAPASVLSTRRWPWSVQTQF